MRGQQEAEKGKQEWTHQQESALGFTGPAVQAQKSAFSHHCSGVYTYSYLPAASPYPCLVRPGLLTPV